MFSLPLFSVSVPFVCKFFYVIYAERIQCPFCKQFWNASLTSGWMKFLVTCWFWKHVHIIHERREDWYKVFFYCPPVSQYPMELAPTRAKFSRNFKFKNAPRWLSKFFSSFWYWKLGRVAKNTLYLTDLSFTKYFMTKTDYTIQFQLKDKFGNCYFAFAAHIY